MTNKSNDLFKFADGMIGDLRADGRFGTAATYLKTMNSLKKFTEGRPIRVDAIDEVFVYKYNRFLNSRGIIKNSVGFYNRVFRSIYNKAIRAMGLQNQSPFAGVYTGVDKTRNRAVSENAMAKLMNLDLHFDKSLELSRNIFIFSFAMRGMSFVDLAYLRTVDIRGGYVCYCRKKTGTFLKVRIEPEAKRIIDRYRSDDSDYVFPIVGSGAEDEQYRRYCSFLVSYNRRLKVLSQLIHESVPLSSYVPRHTWATVARNTNVSLSIISEALGHSSERITRIYLGTFDAALVDRANRKLLRKVQKCARSKE